MPRLCKPSVSVPEYVITMEETLEFAQREHAGKPQLPMALRLMKNTGVRKRHIVQPIEKTLRHPGLEERNRIYELESKKRCPEVIERALANACVAARDIDAIIYVSCTGFLMPSLTAWLINKMGFRSDTRQIPISQLGCAAGGAAINRAHDFCMAYPESNVLIVSCELCSLCYQPDDDGVGSLLSDGLFGDAVAAAVVRGTWKSAPSSESGCGVIGLDLPEGDDAARGPDRSWGEEHTRGGAPGRTGSKTPR
jgi:1,3,6,8-tetrahydroxynaphthalene synthase